MCFLRLIRVCNEHTFFIHKDNRLWLKKQLFDSKRQERLATAAKAATANKEAARAFLIKAGILLPSGEVAPHLR